jgi:hypothetical protein
MLYPIKYPDPHLEKLVRLEMDFLKNNYVRWQSASRKMRTRTCGLSKTKVIEKLKGSYVVSTCLGCDPGIC